MAIIYKANTTLIDNILLNNFSSFGRNSNATTGVITSMTLHKAAVLGIAAGAVLFEIGGHPGVKSIGAILAGVSTGSAIEYFYEVIDSSIIRLGIIANGLSGINDRTAQNNYIPFQNDVQQTVGLNTTNRKIISSDSSNPQSDLVSFFKYHNRFDFIINAINDKIAWVNNNVIFADFSLIGLRCYAYTF